MLLEKRGHNCARAQNGNSSIGNHRYRRQLQTLGVIQQRLYLTEAFGIVIAGGYTLIADYAQRELLFGKCFSVTLFYYIFKVAHGNYLADGSEIVYMVIYMICAYAGKVADYHAGMEGAGLKHGLGKQTVLIRPFKQTYGKGHKPHKAGKPAHDTVGIVGILLAVAVYKLHYFAVYIKYGVGKLKIQLAHGALGAVGALNYHGDG